MSHIHPTAIIESSAKIGEESIIGAYCVIGSEVTLGPRCHLHHHVTVAGPTTIGEKNEFYPYSVIGYRSQDLKYKKEPTFLEIGTQNTFREFVTVHRATESHAVSKIGNHGNFLAYSHIAHDCVVGDHVILSNNGTLGGHVVVEDYVVIGGLSGVHQYCRIGAHAIVGACTKIVQDVPPFLMADGNPSEIRGVNHVGLERRGFTSDTIRELREAYKIIYRSNFNTTQGLEVVRSQFSHSSLISYMVDFINASERGIIR